AVPTFLLFAELGITNTRLSIIVPALRPFGWGDGVIARAAERLTLITRGLDPKSLVPTELGYLELRGEYGPALRGYLAGTPDGVGGWVAYCCRAVAAGARDSLATCEALQRG
ncbi:oxidoreductase, partial [Streptomonospora algeriensis]